MKKIFSILTLSALMLLVMGCDKIDINNTHKPYTPSGGGKTVLIKDFTGVRCSNCPDAAEVVHELQHQLGEDRVLVLSVHAGYLAQAGGQFHSFTTPEGTEWYGSNASNPLFSVDRVGLTDGNTLYVEQIDAPVVEALAEPQTFEVFITNRYEETTRQLHVESEVTALAEQYGSYYVTLCLVEDSIVGRQAIQGGYDTAYVFRDVFRGTLNGAAGEVFCEGQVYVDDDYIYKYDIAVDSAYNADQCYIMTYVHDKTDGKILQTAMKKIK